MKTNYLKWMMLVGGACALTAVIQPRLARSADHLDAPLVSGEPGADINDLYSFQDGNNTIFALTVSPVATAATKFPDVVQYVIHTASGAAFGATTSNVNIICTFDAAQKASCWAGTDQYATGDASAAAGISSADGKFKVYAGVRKDPFFFNLLGFRQAVSTVKSVAGDLVLDDAGCPNIGQANSTALLGQLSGNPDAAANGVPDDFFANLNTLAIVVSIDKSLVTKGGPIVSSWASTNRKP